MKRLTLSDREKKLAGVCGGLGEYFDTDPTIVRLVTVAVAIPTGVIPMFFAYLIAWMIIPRHVAE